MGPKTGKAEQTGDNAWRKQIESIVINDAKFKFKAVILEGAGSEQDFIYLTKFEDYATEEKRYVIKNISKRETNFMINQLGGDKKVRDQSLRVFEEAYEAMRHNNKTIPTDILALLIKYKINEMKINYLNVQKQMEELNIGMRRDSALMLDPVEVKVTAPKPPPEPIESPKQAKKGKKIVDDVITTKEGKKYNTVLRERGEEWRDKIYVDDCPIDGPNLYVILTGFLDPMLLSSLVSVGVPVDALIQLRVDCKLTKVPSSLIRSSKRGQSQTELLANQATQFWTDIQQLRNTPGIAADFKDTSFIVFKPPYWESEPLKGEPDSIYDDISFLLYDIQDLNRQHTNYLKNMNVIHIVQEETPILFYFERYTAVANQIPNESTTIFFVLDCILNAIDNDTECSQDTAIVSKTAPLLMSKIPMVAESKDKKKLEKTKQLVESVYNALQTTHKEKQFFSSEMEDTCPFEDPALIDYGDYLSTICFHFQNSLNIQRIYKIFNGIILTRLWNSITKTSDYEKAKINYHLKVLTNSFEKSNVEFSKLHRLLHILAFKKLFDHRESDTYTKLQTKLDEFKKIYLKRSVFSEPLYRMTATSFSSIATSSRDSSIQQIAWKSSKLIDQHEEINNSNSTLFQCSDISELVSETEMDSKTVAEHMIDSFEYFEDYDFKSSMQILEKAYNEYNCVNFKFCRLTNTVLLFFYNTFNENGIFCDEWKTHLSTPVCIQDFFDFVLDEHYEWFQNEEKSYENMVEKSNKSTQLDELSSALNRSCIEKDILDMDMLIDGSLKHEEYIKLETGTYIRSATDLSTKKSKKSNETVSIMTTSSKKISSKGDKTAESFKSTSFNSIVSLEDSITKPFLGYDLGDRRIEIFGRNAEFFSNDGTKVFTKYYTLFPHNEEYINLQVFSGNKNAHIFIHRPLGIYTKPLKQESVRVSTKTNTQISFQKQSCEAILEKIGDQYENLKKKNSPLFYKNEENSVFTHFYSLAMTCHNGLAIESIHEIKSPSVSHIRQYYLTESKPVKNEEKRCISKFGEVIIFKESGEIEILCPDSSYILCSKYEQRLIMTESGAESEFGDDDSIKKKESKEKQKTKAKEKSPKSVSLAFSTEKQIQKEPVYEIDFREFTLIEANGTQRHCSEGILYEKDVLLIRTATDFNLGEVFSRRMDGTNLLYNYDGTLTVTFPDDTRIINRYYIDDNEVFPEWTEEEIRYFQINKSLNLNENDVGVQSLKNIEKDNTNDFYASEVSGEIARDDGYILVHSVFTIEHINYATVTINTATKEFLVDTPNSVSISVNDQTQYKVALDEQTTLTLNSDVLHMDYIACPELNAVTSCDINISRDDVNNSEQYLWLRLKDSYGKHITVNHEGVFEVIEDNTIENDRGEHEEEKLEETIAPCDKCTEHQLAEKFRFIVLNKDFTVSEFIHKLRIENYKKKCTSHTWGSISNYDVFDDKRRLLSLLLPVNYTEAQKFLMNAKFANKPKKMVFKDLGKNYYKWMRPHERFTPNPRLPSPPVEPEPPKAFILRTLERQWRERDRDKFKGGRELIAAIIKYRRTMEEDKKIMTSDPVHDPRNPEEIEKYERVQELIQRTIDGIQKKLKLFEEAECGELKPLKLVKVFMNRTSEEVLLPKEEFQGENKMATATTSTSETTKDLVDELDEVTEMRPSLQRYWRLHAEEEQEMQYYKEILRVGYVPPYFDNILGGAMWYDVNKVIEAATAKDENAEKHKCWCDGSEASGDAK